MIWNRTSTTLSSEFARLQMLNEQLRQRGIHSGPVLRAMGRLPRERFMPEQQREIAYADQAAAIDCGQTISQPFIVALMTQALKLSGKERVLEIGTGSGYQTAVLAELARLIVTVERHAELSQQAEQVIGELGYRNVRFVVGDGARGAADFAPYDRILVTAAAVQTPAPLIEQLRDGGLLVIPLGGQDGQTLQAIRKVGERRQVEDLGACRFVPFVGAQDSA